MSTTSQSLKPKRRWYRFSLKTLLIVSLALTAGLGWLALRIKRAQANRNRVATIEEPIRNSIRELELAGASFNTKVDEGRSPTFLESLFDDPGDRDDPVRTWNVSFVMMGHEANTDSDLEPLKSLTTIEFLVIRGPNFTDAGMVHLKGLTQVKTLWLNDTSVTDAGLVHLKGLTQLEELSLHQTSVTNAGLVHLEGLTNLKELNLRFTKVTYAEGVKLPDCEILY